MSGPTELYARDSTGIDKPIRRDLDALFSSLYSLIAGEEGQTSNKASYQRVKGKSRCVIVAQTTAVTVGGGAANDTMLSAIRVQAALTGTCVIAGFLDSTGAARSITLPAASVGFFDFRDAVNEAGALTVTCSNGADNGLVSVYYWPSAQAPT